MITPRIIKEINKEKKNKKIKWWSSPFRSILASAVAPVLNGIIGNTFQNDVREKEKGCLQKKKRQRTKRRQDQKDGFIDPFAPSKIIGLDIHQ